MGTTHLASLTVHVLGLILWIGSLFALASVLTVRDREADEGFRAKLTGVAKRIGRSADVGALLAILGGVGMLANDAAYYLRQPWMHAKLTLVVVALGLHSLLRAKTTRGTRLGPVAGPALAVVAAAIVALVVFKPGGR